jgi:predicted alpha/beta hydrolase family esterase
LASSPFIYVVVPGLGDSGPDHWQTLFAAGRRDVRRVRQKDWDRPLRRSWVRGLDETLATTEGQVVLIAHSLGVMTVVHWASRAPAAWRIAGALLVAPPDLEAGRGSIPPRWLMWAAGWTPIPMRRLPFRAVVVGSANDAMCAPARSRAFAQAWGAGFHDLGVAGHINAASGYGSWRGLDRLLACVAD